MRDNAPGGANRFFPGRLRVEGQPGRGSLKGEVHCTHRARVSKVRRASRAGGFLPASARFFNVMFSRIPSSLRFCSTYIIIDIFIC